MKTHALIAVSTTSHDPVKSIQPLSDGPSMGLGFIPHLTQAFLPTHPLDQDLDHERHGIVHGNLRPMRPVRPIRART
jgi:hypothetical protein